MKFFWAMLVSLSVLLSGCSWLYSEDGLIHDSENDYLKAKEENPLVLVEGYQSVRLKDELVIPPLAKDTIQAHTDIELIKQPPLQILAVGQGMRVNRQMDIPAIFWMGEPSDLKQKFQMFLQEKQLNANLDNLAFTTDWVVLDNEAWWRSVFGTALPRFERDKFLVSIEPGERAGESIVSVGHFASEIMPYDEDVWNRQAASYKTATVFLNEFIGYIDYLERKEEAIRLAQLNRGFELTLGKDSNNNAALIANADWRTVWLKSPSVLAPFGFKLADKDQTKGIYFFEFEANEPGFFASLFGSDDGVALELPKGPYQLIIAGQSGGVVSLSFIDTDGNPLGDGRMAQIFPSISEAFGRNTRRKSF